MIEVKLTFSTLQEAATGLARLAGLAQANVGGVPQLPADKPTKEAEAKGAPAPAQKTTQEPVKAPAAAPAPSADDKARYAALQAATMRLAAVGEGTDNEVGRAKVRAILAELGLTTFKGSDPKLWDVALAKVDAAYAELNPTV